jgi:hypothetical protein
MGGTGFQDAITPPWRAKLFTLLWGAIVATMIVGFYALGVVQGFLIVGLFFIVLSLSGVFLVPKPESRHYLRIISQSLIKRTADYARDGDQMRATAAKEIADQLLARYIDRLVDKP